MGHLRKRPGGLSQGLYASTIIVAIELIVGVVFVTVVSIAQLARDLSRGLYQPSDDENDNDDSREA